MDINFELYKTFYRVVQTGSFSKTAEELYISQSAVTQSIKKLEDQLDVVLFIRSKNGVVLTEEGKNLYDFIGQSLETLGNADKLLGQYKNLEKGNIRIAGGSTLVKLILQESLVDFAIDYPNIKISVQNMVTSQAIEKLATGNLDLVLINLPYDVKYDNIKIIELKETEDIFFVNKDFYDEVILKDMDIKNIEDLKKYKLVFPAKGSNSRMILDDRLEMENIVLEPDYEFSSGGLLAKFVSKIDAIGYISKNAIQEKLDNGQLVEIKLDKKFDKRSIGVAVLDKKIANAATLKLLDYLKK